MIERQFQQELLQSKLETQEGTFQQIGKELHDNVGQLLSTTKMLLGITEINLNAVPDTLVTAQLTLLKAIQEIRTLSKSLDKAWLEQFSFVENLKAAVSRINAAGIVAAEFTCSAKLKLQADEQIILFRIVQEAIGNAIKHAEPSKIAVIIIP